MKLVFKPVHLTAQNKDAIVPPGIYLQPAVDDRAEWAIRVAKFGNVAWQDGADSRDAAILKIGALRREHPAFAKLELYEIFLPSDIGTLFVPVDPATAGALVETLERVKDNLEESHQDELATNHNGDGPCGCSYCACLEQAETLINRVRGGAR